MQNSFVLLCYFVISLLSLYCKAKIIIIIITCTRPETPTSEVRSNGVVEVRLLPVCTGDTSISTRSSYREVVSTLHCALENGAGLHVNERQKVRHNRTRSTEERRIRRKKKNAKLRFLTSRGACVNCAFIAILYAVFYG